MGYYNEVFKEAVKWGSKLTDAFIAREVYCVIYGDYTQPFIGIEKDEEFEDICSFVKELYMDMQSYDVNAMVRAVQAYKEEHDYRSYQEMFDEVSIFDIENYMSDSEGL
jgi:uncharacterized protein (UPF0335 family)